MRLRIRKEAADSARKLADAYDAQQNNPVRYPDSEALENILIELQALNHKFDIFIERMNQWMLYERK